MLQPCQFLSVPKVDIYDGRPSILPVRLQLSDFPGDAVSFSSVASSESPARVLTPHACSEVWPLLQLLGLLLIAMFIVFAPVSMIVSELGVISEFSSDTEADLEDKLRQLQPLPAPVSPVSTVPSLRQVELPSSYPAPAVPVIYSTTTSPVILVRSSRTMDAFPMYAGLSGPDLPTSGWASDVMGYLVMTSPVRPKRPLSLLGLETPTLEEPGSLDILLAYDILILDNAADLTQLALPLVPLGTSL